MFIVNPDAFFASVSVFASFISFVVVNPLVAFAFVIAKYTIFGSKPSGNLPLSLKTRTDSAFSNV